MNTLIKSLIAAAVFVPLSASAAEPPAPADAASSAPAQEKLPFNTNGTWKPIAAVMGGVRLPKEALDAITLRVDGENYEVTVAGEPEPDKGTCVVDTSKRPWRMTITGKEGPNKGKTILAIFEMKDEVSMRVCYDLSGKEFPTEFKAKKGTQLYLAGYRRQKE
ncbi:MAG: TIGR03067 domain-containing protein [Chthoniobacteraceae bacterium]